jgi:hypothetical protein
MTVSSSQYKALPCVEFDRDGARCELPMGHVSADGEARHRTSHAGRVVEWSTGMAQSHPARRAARYR